MTSARSVLLPTGVCLALLGAAQISAARTPVGATRSFSDVPTAAVLYRPAELQSDASALRLLNRIQSAARAVCEDYRLDSAIIQTPAWHNCVHAAMARAVESLQSVRLTQLWIRQYPNRWHAAEPATIRSAAR